MRWGWWRREVPPPDPVKEEPVLIIEEPETPGDGEFEFDEGDGESEEEEFLESLEVMVWRMRSGENSTVIGVTQDLGSDERIWFRVRDDGRGDRLHDSSVVAEVRVGERARERTAAMTEMYRARGWRMVDGPRLIEVPVPGLTAVDVLMGTPLSSWAYHLAAKFTAREL